MKIFHILIFPRGERNHDSNSILNLLFRAAEMGEDVIVRMRLPRYINSYTVSATNKKMHTRVGLCSSLTGLCLWLLRHGGVSNKPHL